MTKEELLNIGLNVREFDAFGGTVKIRDLTVKEVVEVAKEEDNYIGMIKTVSYSLVDPAMTVAELETLGAKEVKDFARIVEAVVN